MALRKLLTTLETEAERQQFYIPALCQNRFQTNIKIETKYQ